MVVKAEFREKGHRRSEGVTAQAEFTSIHLSAIK